MLEILGIYVDYSLDGNLISEDPVINVENINSPDSLFQIVYSRLICFMLLTFIALFLLFQNVEQNTLHIFCMKGGVLENITITYLYFDIVYYYE